MNPQRPPVVSIVGRSKTGKTTLLEKVISLLAAQGIRVAVIKHHHGDFEMDLPGKDTYRHKKAGAALTILASPNKVGLVRDLGKELTLEEIIGTYVQDVDLIITEGYKKGTLPKIEVFLPKGPGEGEPVCMDDPGLIALVTDVPVVISVPVFSRDNAEGVASLIVNRIIDGRIS